MKRLDSVLPVRRLSNHHMIPLRWQKIFVKDIPSSRLIKYALAQELKSKTGVRHRLYLLSTPTEGSSNGGETTFLFSVLSAWGAAAVRVPSVPQEHCTARTLVA